MSPRSLFRNTIALAALAGALCPSAAQADTLFSNFPYVSGGGTPIQDELAAQFTPSQTATLDSIVLPLEHDSGDNNAVTVTLYTTDSTGMQLGTALATATIAPDTVASSTTAYTVAFNGPVLSAGTSYFVDVKTTGDTFDYWAFNDLTNNDPNYIVPGLNGTPLFVAFQVNGTPLSVPEPAFYQMGALVALGGFSLLRRRRSSAP